MPCRLTAGSLKAGSLKPDPFSDAFVSSLGADAGGSCRWTGSGCGLWKVGDWSKEKDSAAPIQGKATVSAARNQTEILSTRVYSSMHGCELCGTRLEAAPEKLCGRSESGLVLFFFFFFRFAGSESAALADTLANGALTAAKVYVLRGWKSMSTSCGKSACMEAQAWVSRLTVAGPLPAAANASQCCPHYARLSHTLPSGTPQRRPSGAAEDDCVASFRPARPF